MLDFIGAQVRRPAGDDDRRERPRHPERQHDHHQPRRSLRPVAALPAARPRRPIGSAGLRLPADSARGHRCRRSRSKRLAAIKEFSDLGSGFRVAALDLEIRGAGNLLGGEQSGHIEAVGFEMYMKLLEETVRELKGEELEDDVRATVNLRVDLQDRRRATCPDMNQRLMIYRKVAAARAATTRSTASLDEAARPLRPAADVGAQPGRLRPHPRHGRPAGRRDHRPGRPHRRLKVQAAGEGRSGAARGAGAAAARAARSSRLRPSSWISRLAAQGSRPAGEKPDGQRQPAPARPSLEPQQGGSAARRAAPSWWTARATAGEVTPGFTKAEILRPRQGRPAGAGRRRSSGSAGLLSELLGSRVKCLDLSQALSYEYSDDDSIAVGARAVVARRASPSRCAPRSSSRSW